MSHYAVAVFSDDGDFDRLLAPYSHGDPKYQKFIPVEYSDILKGYEQFKEYNKRRKLDEYISIKKYCNVDGQWGYYSNPNGRYDYYTLDGRSYLFSLKTEKYHPDDYRKNDFDWFPDMSEEAKDAGEYWDDFIGESALGEPPGIFSRKYFRERYKTREQYVKEASRIIPYAFITPDGVWHSAGKVVAFGMSSETAEDSDRYAEEWYAWINSDANPYVNLVDCHI